MECQTFEYIRIRNWKSFIKCGIQICQFIPCFFLNWPITTSEKYPKRTKSWHVFRFKNYHIVTIKPSVWVWVEFQTLLNRSITVYFIGNCCKLIIYLGDIVNVWRCCYYTKRGNETRTRKEWEWERKNSNEAYQHILSCAMLRHSYEWVCINSW